MINLTNVEAKSGDFERLPVGGYVCVIKSAKDYPTDEFVEIVYDVTEGQYANFYKNDEDWTHTTRKYYKGKAAGMFKGFIETLAKDNPSFDASKVINGESVDGMKGCKFGALIQERYYTNQNGEDKTALDVARTVECAKIRDGKFTLPAPKDMRKNQTTPATPAVQVVEDDFNGDVPF